MRDRCVLRLQLGDYGDIGYASGYYCFSGVLFIVLDPFAPLDDGFDGHLTSKSLLEITPDNWTELEAENFKTFSFFSTEKTTIGLVQNSSGASGLGSHRYVLYDIKTGITAFLLIWKELPGWRILGRIIGVPVVYHLVEYLYVRFAEYRFKRVHHCKLIE